MNRTLYLLVLIVLIFIAGAIYKEEFPSKVFVFMPFYIAIITILRQRYMKMTWKQILKAPLSFKFKERIQIFTEK